MSYKSREPQETNIRVKIGIVDYLWLPKTKWPSFGSQRFWIYFTEENSFVSVKISPKFVATGPMNRTSPLVQVIPCRQTSAKPLSKIMMAYCDRYAHRSSNALNIIRYWGIGWFLHWKNGHTVIEFWQQLMKVEINWPKPQAWINHCQWIIRRVVRRTHYTEPLP